MPKKTSTSAIDKGSKPAPPTQRFWLVKSEPDVFSIQDLAKAKNQTTYWDGVRNYQARNTLRDQMKAGDKVLFYHSNAMPPAIAGVARVVKEGYPDHTAWDPKSDHFDPKSSKENPTWYMVDIQLVEVFPKPLGLPMLKEIAGLKSMVLVQRGSRLSVQPVTASEFQLILELANAQH
jgi:predicted RNA-binding protein with PUA-like domain